MEENSLVENYDTQLVQQAGPREFTIEGQKKVAITYVIRGRAGFTPVRNALARFASNNKLSMKDYRVSPVLTNTGRRARNNLRDVAQYLYDEKRMPIWESMNGRTRLLALSTPKVVRDGPHQPRFVVNVDAVRAEMAAKQGANAPQQQA